MSPRQLLTLVMTSSAVLVVIGGLVAMPLGVRTYHGLMTQRTQQIGNRPPPFAFDVLHPMTIYQLGAMGLAIALAGAFLPARRAARSRAAEILRSGWGRVRSVFAVAPADPRGDSDPILQDRSVACRPPT